VVVEVAIHPDADVASAAAVKAALRSMLILFSLDDLGLVADGDLPPLPGFNRISCA
jgi:hypothetical protein